MNSRKKSRLFLSVVSAALLSIVCASSQAGRSVRSDASDGAFEFLGGFWGSDIDQFGGPSFDAGKTDFKLKINPNGKARFFHVCMGEGFVKLIGSDQSCVEADFARPPTGNYIAVFATDFDDSSGRFARTRGFVDSAAPYRLGQAAPAMRFWWNGVTLAGDSTFSAFDVQIVLIDRSNGTNNGNFDIELNYGTGGGDRFRRSPTPRASRVSCSGPIPAGRRSGHSVLSIPTARRFAFASAAASCRRPASNRLREAIRLCGWLEMTRASIHHASEFLQLSALACRFDLCVRRTRGRPEPCGGVARGWQLEGDTLTWASARPLRIGGARFEFRSGTRLLGYPVQKANRLSLRLTSGEPLTELSVWAAGRRIDGPATARIAAPAVLPFEPAIAVAAFDPSTPGRYQTRRLHYRLAGLEVPDYPAPIEVVAEVTAPVGRDTPMPLVLFLHGRHSTCYRGGPTGEASGDWPCPDGWRPVPSHTGYRYIADVLASQGYLIVSIAANGINGQDGLFIDGGASARSELVRHHLAQWAEWSTAGGDPWGGRFQGRVNMNKVVLVGHSRGGEGVERAAIDSRSADPWKIQGLVLIGPTAFGRQVAAGVHTTVLLPFCDGDVSDLQGQQYVDIGRDLTRDPALQVLRDGDGDQPQFLQHRMDAGPLEISRLG